MPQTSRDEKSISHSQAAYHIHRGSRVSNIIEGKRKMNYLITDQKETLRQFKKMEAKLQDALRVPKDIEIANELKRKISVKMNNFRKLATFASSTEEKQKRQCRS